MEYDLIEDLNENINIYNNNYLNYIKYKIKFNIYKFMVSYTTNDILFYD